MSRYAATTSVPAERSRQEIERTLTRYGATKFMYGWDQDAAVIAFSAHDRYIRFRLPLPDRDDCQLTHHSRGRRTDTEIERRWEQATRQRWRALAGQRPNAAKQAVPYARRYGYAWQAPPYWQYRVAESWLARTSWAQ